MGSLGINSIDGDMNPYLSLTAGMQAQGMFIFLREESEAGSSGRMRESNGETIHLAGRTVLLYT